MAKVKVKLDDFKKIEKNIQKSLSKELSKTLPKVLEKAIVKDSILKGKSPVRGKRFVKYSDSYKDQIKRYLKAFGKRVSPVNMKLSGQMLSTFTVKVLKTGKFIVEFKDKLADIHNSKGAGKSKVIRRLLPTNDGEKFNLKITAQINKALDKALRKIRSRRR